MKMFRITCKEAFDARYVDADVAIMSETTFPVLYRNCLN